MVIAAGLIAAVLVARPTDYAAANPPAILIDPPQGQTVMLAVGVPQTVSLPATPGTGYAWDAGTLPPGLQATGSKTVPNQPGLAGGRAQQLMTFVSSAPGEAEITFVLRRAWMPPDPSDQRVTIIFNTKP